MSAQPIRPAVLVVEDESLVRMFAVDVIEEEGYEVVEAANAQQALATLAARPDIGVIFTDINMPGEMDGIGLAQAVQKLRPDVHVILTSGKRAPYTDQLPEHQTFVTKPYTAQQLVRLLGKAVI